MAELAAQDGASLRAAAGIAPNADALAIGKAVLAAALGDTAVADLVGHALAGQMPQFHRGVLRDRPHNAFHLAGWSRPAYGC